MNFKARSHRAKAKEKAKILFDVLIFLDYSLIFFAFDTASFKPTLSSHPKDFYIVKSLFKGHLYCHSEWHRIVNLTSNNQ